MHKVASFEIFLRNNKSKMTTYYPFLSQDQIMSKLRQQWNQLDEYKRLSFSKLVITKKPKVGSQDSRLSAVSTKITNRTRVKEKLIFRGISEPEIAREEDINVNDTDTCDNLNNHTHYSTTKSTPASINVKKSVFQNKSVLHTGKTYGRQFAMRYNVLDIISDGMKHGRPGNLKTKGSVKKSAGNRVTFDKTVSIEDSSNNDDELFIESSGSDCKVAFNEDDSQVEEMMLDKVKQHLKKRQTCVPNNDGYSEPIVTPMTIEKLCTEPTKGRSKECYRKHMIDMSPLQSEKARQHASSQPEVKPLSTVARIEVLNRKTECVCSPENEMQPFCDGDKFKVNNLETEEKENAVDYLPNTDNDDDELNRFDEEDNEEDAVLLFRTDVNGLDTEECETYSEINMIVQEEVSQGDTNNNFKPGGNNGVSTKQEIKLLNHEMKENKQASAGKDKSSLHTKSPINMHKAVTKQGRVKQVINSSKKKSKTLKSKRRRKLNHESQANSTISKNRRKNIRNCNNEKMTIIDINDASSSDEEITGGFCNDITRQTNQALMQALMNLKTTTSLPNTVVSSNSSWGIKDQSIGRKSDNLEIMFQDIGQTKKGEDYVIPEKRRCLASGDQKTPSNFMAMFETQDIFL